MMSLMPTGTPCSGPRTRPAAISVSAARAASIAASASSRMKACSFGSSRSMRASSAFSSSTGESCAGGDRPRRLRGASCQCELAHSPVPARIGGQGSAAGSVGAFDRPRLPPPVRRRRRHRRGIPPAPCPGRRRAPAFRASLCPRASASPMSLMSLLRRLCLRRRPGRILRTLPFGAWIGATPSPGDVLLQAYNCIRRASRAPARRGGAGRPASGRPIRRPGSGAAAGRDWR